MAYPTLSEILGSADPVTGALSPELQQLLDQAFAPEQPQQLYSPPAVTGRQRGFAWASDIAAALANAYRVPAPINATEDLYQREQLRNQAMQENARRVSEAGASSKRARALEMLQMLQRERELQGRERPERDAFKEKTIEQAKSFGLSGIVADLLSGNKTPGEASVIIAQEQALRDQEEAKTKAEEKAQKRKDAAEKKAESDLKTGGLSPGQMRKVNAIRASIKVKLARVNRELTTLQNVLEFRMKVSNDPEHDPSVQAAQARVTAKLDEIQALEHDFEKAGNVAPEPPPKP